VGGATPPHAITSPVRGAVGVVAAAIEEGEVAQGTMGVSTSGSHNGWNRDREISPYNISIMPCYVFFIFWGL